MSDNGFKKRVHNEIANATVKIFVADEFLGSGFFINAEGYALTAYHCIGNCAPAITITTRFGDQFKAELDEAKSLKHDKYDIAVLKIDQKVDQKVDQYVPLGLISNQQVMDEIVAIGYPAGNQPNHDKIGFFFSKISQIRSDNKIQIPDAIKGKGQSGGPVYHEATQRVIGLTLGGYPQDILTDTGSVARFDALFEKWPELDIINHQVAQTWEKRLAQLRNKEGNHLIDTTNNSNPTSQAKKLSRDFFNQHPEEKRKLINALFDCPSIKNNQLRQTVIEQLPSEIADNIPHLSHSKPQIVKMVDTCLNYSGGLLELIEAIRFFDEGTEQMQVLDRFIEQLSECR
ncbi:conserved hypothetical protein [Beggiatoa sp. PS]|nr:conserved hypothetical protein [Beggiatoa sp. PS]